MRQANAGAELPSHVEDGLEETSMQAILGVDVSKAELVVARPDQSGVERIPNQVAAIRAWLSGLPGGSALGVEPTGGYETVLVDAAATAGHTVYLLDPAALRHYRRALGGRAKTDRCDAQWIARYVAHEQAQLRPYRPLSMEQRRWRTLQSRRSRLVTLTQTLRQTLAALPELARERDDLVARLQALIRVLDHKIEALVRERAPLAEAADRLAAIPGIGPVATHTLLGVFTRRPFASSDAVVAYVGLDPRPHDSGRHQGRRHLTKRGDPEARRVLYPVAMAAARLPLWQPYYDRARDQGWSRLEALIILARRLLRVAWAVFRSAKPFDPARIKFACART